MSANDRQGNRWRYRNAQATKGASMTPTTTRELADALRKRFCEVDLFAGRGIMNCGKCDRCIALAAHDAATHASAQQAGTRVVTDADVAIAKMKLWGLGYHVHPTTVRNILESFAATLAQPTQDGAQQAEQEAVWVRKDDLQKAMDSAYMCRLVGGKWARRDKDMVPLYAHPTPASVPAQVDDETMRNKYHELLLAVACKFPNESRHETALRYIRERELREVASSSAEGKGAKITQGNDRGSGGGA